MSVGPEAKAAAEIGLPLTSFLYTVDQICMLLAMNQQQAMRTIFYFDMRSTGVKSPHQMMARNIALPNDTPDWRVAEHEFVRWLRVKRFRVDQTGTIRY